MNHFKFKHFSFSYANGSWMERFICGEKNGSKINPISVEAIYLIRFFELISEKRITFYLPCLVKVRCGKILTLRDPCISRGWSPKGSVFWRMISKKTDSNIDIVTFFENRNSFSTEFSVAFFGTQNN